LSQWVPRGSGPQCLAPAAPACMVVMPMPLNIYLPPVMNNSKVIIMF